MTGPSYLHAPQVHRLPIILAEIRRRRWRVPRFQRPFVWTPQQRLDLLDSIYKGLPIGSVMLWRTRKHELKCYAWRGVTAVPETNRLAGEAVDYVLDGHQRLTTLYHALGPGLGEELGDDSPAPASDGPGESPDGGPIFFDLRERSFELWRRKGPPPSTWLPLAVALDGYQVDEFRDKLPRADDRRMLYNRVATLVGRLKDYQIPVIPLVTEELQQAVDAFTAVNEQGTRMSEVDLTNALSWSASFDLNERLEVVDARLAECRWQGFDKDLVLKTCKALLGLDMYKAGARALRDELDKKPDIVIRAGECLFQAAGFLRHRGIYSPSVLPYSFQAVILATVFDGPVDDAARRRLANWVWTTTYGEYFAGMSSTRLRRAHEFVLREVVQGSADRPPDLEVSIAPTGRFDFRAARSRAAALLLARLQGAKKSQGRRRGFRLLATHGKDATPKIFSRREVGGNPHHELWCNRWLVEPGKQARRLKDRLLAGELDQDELTRNGIPESAMQSLKVQDWVGFLKARLHHLDELEAAFVGGLGMKMEPRAS